MDAVNLCEKCALNMTNYLNELNKNADIKYLYTMAKWRIERDRAKIKQLEADSGNWKSAYNLADKERNKLEQKNQKLREAIGNAISGLSSVRAIWNSPQMDNSHGTKAIRKLREVQQDLVIAQKALEDK